MRVFLVYNDDYHATSENILGIYSSLEKARENSNDWLFIIEYELDNPEIVIDRNYYTDEEIRISEEKRKAEEDKANRIYGHKITLQL